MKALILVLISSISLLVQAQTQDLATAFTNVTTQKVTDAICGHFVYEAGHELEDCTLEVTAHHMNPSRTQPDVITSVRTALIYTGIVRANVKPTPDSKIYYCEAQSYMAPNGALNLEEIECQ